MRKYGVLFIVGVIALLNFAVPPFQTPDESYHFALAVIYARGEAARMEVEKSVIAMMDRAHWWRLVGIGRPAVLPERLSDIKFLFAPVITHDFWGKLANLHLWHYTLGFVLKPIAGWSLERLYFLCRLMVAVQFGLALFFIWRIFEILAVAFGGLIRLGFYLTLFMPQFLLTAVSVSPDPLILMMSAAFFYGAASLMVGTPRAWNVLFLLLLVIFGLLIDRSIFFLAVLVVSVPFFFLRWSKNHKKAAIYSIGGAIVVVLVGFFVSWRFPSGLNPISIHIQYFLDGVWKAFPKMFKLDLFGREYWTAMGDGLLLRFGWQVFEAPKFVYWVWRGVCVAGMAGLIGRAVWWGALKIKGAGATQGEGTRIRWILFSAIGLGVQVTGVWVLYGMNHIIGQARYIFPLIVPIAVFAVLGLSAIGEIFKRGAGRTVVLGVVLAEFLLLTFTVWHDIVPAFHMILRGPHPGV